MTKDNWKDIRKILCVRLDNMGDVMMSEPAMRAIKESFGCELTLLTSSAGGKIASQINCVDRVIEYNVPWVKLDDASSDHEFFNTIIKLKNESFDAAIIFTVFSQNPLPAAMMLWLAGIPKRLAYCRENPYQLLTHWVPEKEPYDFIRHQVKRDLDLIETVGAFTDDDSIHLNTSKHADISVEIKLAEKGIGRNSTYIILHPGVSERKREYPAEHWIEIARELRALGFDVVVTGAKSEAQLASHIARHGNCVALTGDISVEEFISLVNNAALVISVNTSTIHIAAATQTKVIALYALTNPQHTPWKGVGFVMPYSVPQNQQSKNQVLNFVSMNFFPDYVAVPTPTEVILNAKAILFQGAKPLIPEMITTQHINLHPALK